MLSKNITLSFILFLAGSAFILQDNGTEQDTVAIEEERREGNTVSVIRVEGVIGPTTTQYIERGLRKSIENDDEAFIIELDTPGGLLDSTQDIVQILLGTEHPTVVLCITGGANAGSAGTFITLAAHVAAMAPATNIGAASPVTMGGGEMDTVAQKKIFSLFGKLYRIHSRTARQKCRVGKIGCS
jgi:membrane-bound serine protease (ClpP class)